MRNHYFFGVVAEHEELLSLFDTYLEFSPKVIAKGLFTTDEVRELRRDLLRRIAVYLCERVAKYARRPRAVATGTSSSTTEDAARRNTWVRDGSVDEPHSRSRRRFSQTSPRGSVAPLRTLWVRRSWTRGRLGTTKGGRSRAVDLSPQVVQVLGDWMSVQEAEAAVEGKAPSPWLFPSSSGDPWDDRWVRWHIWRPLLRRPGLRHRGPHQLRHTYASLLIAAGGHPKYIQAQLGHASIQVTMDVYGHLFPGTFARLVDALDHAVPHPVPWTLVRREHFPFRGIPR